MAPLAGGACLLALVAEAEALEFTSDTVGAEGLYQKFTNTSEFSFWKLKEKTIRQLYGAQFTSWAQKNDI